MPISAYLDRPLGEADVEVEDTAGHRLFAQSGATNDQGFFPAHVSALPRNFRVLVTFDHDQLLGRFTLSADVRNFDPVEGVVYVDPATTLASRVVDRLSNHDLALAQDCVRRFLKLPAYGSLGAALRESAGYHSPYFSELAFVQQAEHDDGVERLLDELTYEIVDHSWPGHAFLGAPAARAAAGPLAFIGTNLAVGAVSYVGGQGIGWVLAQAGLFTPGATAAQIKELQARLADLQSSVDNLSSQLQSLTQEVRAKLTETQLALINVQALPLATRVNKAEGRLSLFAAGCPPLIDPAGHTPFDQWCGEEKTDLRQRLVELDDSFELLSTYLLDRNDVGFKGIIHLYSQSLAESVPFFRPADSTKIDAMFDYWNSIEVQAANLQVELLHLKGAQNSAGGILALHDFLGDATATPPTLGRFQKTIAAEKQLIFPAVPYDSVIDTRSRSVWLVDYPANLRTSECYEEHASSPIFQPVSLLYSHYKWRSPTLEEAKGLIASWSGSSPNQWLTEKTRAVAPETPRSRGFANIISDNCRGTSSPSIWTRDATGKTQIFRGEKYSIYYLLNLRDGSVPTPSLSGGVLIVDPRYGAFANWNFVLRSLEAGEQYYWYAK